MTPQTLTPTMLESRSHRLDERIHRRNRFEYIAGGIAIAGSLLLGLWLLLDGPVGSPDLMVGGGFLALAIGALVAMIQLRRRTGGGRVPDGAQSTMMSYRAELVRQRDALRSVFGWYNGDFNYDGKINIDDYGIIDFNVTAQTGVFPATVGVEGVTAIPEPAAVGLLVVCGALAQRRRAWAPARQSA